MNEYNFITASPTLDAYWRAIILFGRNTASYKFALAKSLLDLASEEKTIVTLDELAIPFSQHIVDHLQKSDRQGNFQSSRFLDACRHFNQGELSEDQLHAQTVELGFVNVIDAFHRLNQAEIPVQFYVDERKTRGGITVTDELLSLKNTLQSVNFPLEIEARWRRLKPHGP